MVRCGNAHKPTQLSQQPSVCYNGSRWSHGETEPGVVTLSWDHVTGGQQGQKEMTESLSLDPMLQTKSLKVGYLRSRIIPPPPPPRNLGLSVFGPTHVIRKIPGQRSSKPVPQESPLWLSRRESDS